MADRYEGYEQWGHLLAACGGEQHVHVWDMDKERMVATIGATHCCDIQRIDQTHIAVSEWYNPFNIRIYDISSNRECLDRKLEGHTSYIWRMTLIPPGSCGFGSARDILVSAAEDKSVIWWDLSTSKKVHQGRSGFGRFYSLTYDPLLRQLVGGTGSGSVHIIDHTTGKLKLTMQLQGQTGSFLGLAVDPQRCLYYTGSYNGSIQFWDPKSGEAVENISARKSASLGPGPSPAGESCALLYVPESEAIVVGCRPHVRAFDVRMIRKDSEKCHKNAKPVDESAVLAEYDFSVDGIQASQLVWVGTRVGRHSFAFGNQVGEVFTLEMRLDQGQGKTSCRFGKKFSTKDYVYGLSWLGAPPASEPGVGLWEGLLRGTAGLEEVELELQERLAYLVGTAESAGWWSAGIVTSGGSSFTSFRCLL